MSRSTSAVLPIPALALLVILGLPSPGRAQVAAGAEFVVNGKTAGRQAVPDVGAAADGHFVVAWVDGGVRGTPSNVMARILEADGRPRTGDLRVSLGEPGFQDHPRVAVAADGSFVVVWSSRVSALDPSRVYGRRFTAGGVARGQRFRLGLGYGQPQSEPDVACAPDGQFVAVWTEEDERHDSHGAATTDVLARRFGADGRPLAPEWTAIGGELFQGAPAVSMNASGAFVIAAEDNSSGVPSDVDVFAGAYAPDGKLRSFTNVPNFYRTDTNQKKPAVAMEADGGYVLVWEDSRSDHAANVPAQDDPGVAALRIDPQGRWITLPLSINTTVRSVQSEPAVAASPDGGFLVTWTSAGGQDGDGRGVFAQRYTANGAKNGVESALATYTAGNQSLSAVAIAPSGFGLAVWQSMRRDGDDFAVAARRVDVRPN